MIAPGRLRDGQLVATITLTTTQLLASSQVDSKLARRLILSAALANLVFKLGIVTVPSAVEYSTVTVSLLDGDIVMTKTAWSRPALRRQQSKEAARQSCGWDAHPR